MPSCENRRSQKCSYEENCYSWEDDGAAWGFLASRGYTENRFLIRIAKGREPTMKEWAALCYLANEWDWAWEAE